MTRYFTVCLMTLTGGFCLAPGEARSQEPSAHDRPFVWKGMVERGYLGLQVLNMTPELRLHYGAPEDEGVLVARVEDGSPAAGAGILVGDIVTAVDGESISSQIGLSHAVGNKREGDLVTVELWRDGSARSLPVTLAERDRRVVRLATLADGEPGRGVRVFIPGSGLHLDETAIEALEQAREKLLERFESGEWERKLRTLQEINVSEMERRMRELEERLRELELELEREARERQ